ncbi:MAG: hypothetical protein ACI9WU_002714, partial [Myxococcota bacterium]
MRYRSGQLAAALLCIGLLCIGPVACGADDPAQDGQDGAGTTGDTADVLASDALIDDAGATSDGGPDETADVQQPDTVEADTVDPDAGTGGDDDAGTTDGDPDGGTTGVDVGPPPECKNNADCDDGDSCTNDACSNGKCQNLESGDCAPNSPCEESSQPGANDAAIVACVCGLDTYCCDTAWDSLCVSQADEQCGAPCSCEELTPEELPCVSDGDCAFCDDFDACNGAWGCVGGTCVPTPPVECDAALSTGCMQNICDQFSGACQLTPDFPSCDDADPCTADACEASGECTNVAVEGCGENHPCEVANTPGSKSDEITACVCAVDSYCCSFSWDNLCVTQAQEQCGASCACADATPEELACEDSSDCTYCNTTGDLCTGSWACVEGVCADQGAVECDTSNDFGCVQTSCNPLTGLCGQAAKNDVCVDTDVCTSDSCDAESGGCINLLQEGCGLNHPCQSATTPGSQDEEANTCVCGLAPECCDDQWFDYCAFFATDFCAINCECATFAPEDLACEVDADCGFCDPDQYACNGGWTCQDNICAEIPAFEGDCLDEDPCTNDGCDLDLMECTHEPIEGCGLNHPCQSAQTPGTSDPVVEACVCAQDAYCCDVAWGGTCVGEATSLCDVQCDCAAAAPEALACEADADCGYCDPDGTICNGGWSCLDGTCAVSDPIDCGDPDNIGCLVLKCVPELAGCDYVAVPGICADGDACTTDTCDTETGDCSSEPNADECGQTHPCQVAATPGSNSPSVSACVCAIEPACCTDSWSDICVQITLFECGYDCGCAQKPPVCAEDADCATCNDEDLCNG